MTSTNDGSTLLTLTKWADDGHYLRDFLQKYQLPQVARIIKGQYLTLGVPSLPNPSLNQLVFLCSTGKRLKVAAQCVKFKEGNKKVVPIGPKLAIPENYEGWFEILSEEGRAVRCIESVMELARRFPDSCLVRESIKAYVAKGDDIETITDKVRTVAAGETLVLISEVLGTSANPKPDKSRATGRFLRCFDSRGENVYLSFEQRGKFSIIAKEDNISGVHSIKNLLTKRFPLMVRLVSGKTPVGGKAASAFVPEMRLYASFEEECVMALPLHKEPSIVAVPTTALVKLQGPKNADVLQKTKEYTRLEDMCKLLIEDISDKIQVFDIMLSRELKNDALSRKLPYFRRAFSDPYGYRLYSSEVKEQDMPDKDDTRYDEIDQIYDYVRGFAPPPKFTESTSEPVSKTTNGPPASTTHQDSLKPDPPPIETIPIRRHPDVVQVHPTTTATPPVIQLKRATENLYERIPRKDEESALSKKQATRFYVHTRTSKNKIYIKSSGLNRGLGVGGPKSRFFRQQHKNHPSTKDVPKTVRSVKSSATSPIFNIRYKSLTNLALEFNTLDSSNSGGKISGGSGGSYIIEDSSNKKTRLPRPKSLTNLVWDLNNHMDYNRANILNSAICRLDPRRRSHESSQSTSKESESRGNTTSSNNNSNVVLRTNKRIGTLYL